MVRFEGQKAIECFDTYVDSNNVEYALFLNYKNQYSVRLFDLDADKLVGLIVWPNQEKAKAYFNECVLTNN